MANDTSIDYFAPPPDLEPCKVVGDRVYGWLCQWDLVRPSMPRPGMVDYDLFLTGLYLTAHDGDVKTGPLLLGVDLATAVADVTVGEDDRGAWFSGRLRPGAVMPPGWSASGEWRPLRLPRVEAPRTMRRRLTDWLLHREPELLPPQVGPLQLRRVVVFPAQGFIVRARHHA